MLDNVKTGSIIQIMPEPQNPHFGDLNKTNAQPEINASNSGAGQNSNFGLVGKPAIESLPIGVVAFDCDLKIIEANSQAAKLIKLGNYIDRSLAKSSDDSSASKLDWKEQLKTAISEGKSHKFDNVNYILNGKTKLLQIVCTPFKVAKDLGGIITIEDVTEKANIQKQLANAEKLATKFKAQGIYTGIDKSHTTQPVIDIRHQQALGHRSIASTLRYCQVPSKALVAALEAV